MGESARAHFHLLVSIYSSERIRILMQDLGYACSTPRGGVGVTLLEDTMRQEANCINNE
jgi:hypothetical protein